MSDKLLQENGFRCLLDAAPDPLVVVDRRGDVVAANREAEQRFGWAEADLVGHPIDQLIPPRFQRVHLVQRASQAASPAIPPTEAPVSLFVRRRDGTEFPVEISQKRLGSGKDALIVVTIRDLTEWRRAHESLFQEKEQAVATLESIGDAVLTTDAAGMITYMNPVAERLTGWRVVEALGQPVDTVMTLISDAARLPADSTAARCLREGRTVTLGDGVLLLRRDGTEVAIADSAAPIRDRNGGTTGVVLVFHDVTERRRAAHKLSHAATHDALTGLVNRGEFERRLTRVVADAADDVDAGVEHALLYLDLDGFKPINDVNGHDAGDELLRQIGALLSGQMRRRDTLARLGGDEFGALIEHCPLAEAGAIAEKLRRTVEDFASDGTTRASPWASASAWFRSPPPAGERLPCSGPPTPPAMPPRTREATGFMSSGCRRSRASLAIRRLDGSHTSLGRWTRAAFSCTRSGLPRSSRSDPHVPGARFCCACRTSRGAC